MRINAELEAAIRHHQRRGPRFDAEVIGDLLQPCDRGMDFTSGKSNYTWFRAIGAALQPYRILELGSRYGYSMKAFVDGAAHPAAEYQLNVIDCEADGGEPLSVLEGYFLRKGYIGLKVQRADTQDMTKITVPEPVELAFVDGEHTAAGCEHECQLAWEVIRPGGVMLVDDVRYPHPRYGANQFLRKVGVEPIELPTLRGLFVAIKPDCR